jgi:hypothetical protein
MAGVLMMEGAMDYPWNRLNMIGIKESEDEKVKIFTWHLVIDPDHYRYFGFIQLRMKRGRIKVFQLIDNEKKQRNLHKLEQSPQDWYGKLYYGIVTKRHKRKSYYTLLGMDFNTSRSVIKTVECMAIQRNKPQFTQEQFFDGRDRQDRLVLEYSSQVAISVRYDPGLEMITFDHLVPFHPIYDGNFEFYGPEGSFDGLEFVNGTWVYREDIDARNID